MVAVGKDFVLIGQIGAAAIDQIDAGQLAFLGDFLRAQVLFHRHRVIGAALDRRVIGNDHHVEPVDATDPGDDAGAGRRIVIHAIGRRRADFQKRAARIKKVRNPLTRRHLAARGVPLHRLGATSGGGGQRRLARGGEHLKMRGTIGPESVR